jgi:hypothetical protein
MDQPEDLVSGGKSRDESLSVFNHPALEVVGYAGVQVSRPAGQDVNPIRAAHFAIPVSNSRSLTTVRQRQVTGFGMTANLSCAGLEARHRPFTVSSGPHHTTPDASVIQLVLDLSSRTRPDLWDGVEESVFPSPQSSPRLGILHTSHPPTDQCISDYSLDGWKDSTWVWDK